MSRSTSLVLIFLVAVLLYLPTVRFGYVQDDRAVIVAAPAAHSLSAAVRAFDQPYWPEPSTAGYYRPLTTLSFAVDWVLSGGSPAWLHLANALWHGLVCVLVVLVLARWLPPGGALAAGLLFAVHPVHVEGVANIVSRNELLASAGILGAVLLARRRWWILAVLCAALGMLSKERGVIVAALIFLDDRLRPRDTAPYPLPFYGALALATGVYLLLWLRIGHTAPVEVAAPFIGAGVRERLAMAFPGVFEAARLLFWPVSLSADYGPQVIPFREGFSAAALGGLAVVIGMLWLVMVGWRRAPAVSFAALVAGLAYLPSANLLFPSGVVLSERDLYLPVLLPAALFGAGIAWWQAREARAPARFVAVVVLGLLAARTLIRLPAWADNRAFLVTLLEQHPESYRGQQSAAAVFAGMGKAAEARHAYARADSLFGRDPHLAADYAFFVIGQGDTAMAARLVQRARARLPRERVALRVDYLLALARGHPTQAAAIADTAGQWFPEEQAWYAAPRKP